MATDQGTINSYNQNAKDYDEHLVDSSKNTFHALYEKPAIRAELPKLDGLSVISIGCGSGHDANWLLQNGASSVVGVDISEGLIKIAESKFPNIEVHVMDMEKLDFPDNSFDLAYSSLAIHYVDDWTQSLKEAHRVIKPGSLYVFSCGHPIDSAMQYDKEGKYRFARIGRRVNDNTGERIIFGDYLAKDGKGTKPVKGVLGEVEVTVFHHTFSVMIQQILESGFEVVKVVEPQPVEEMKSTNEGRYRQLSRVPAFMIWVLRKN